MPENTIRIPKYPIANGLEMSETRGIGKKINFEQISRFSNCYFL